jgi:YesN/AraC family two-component response regulator
LKKNIHIFNLQSELLDLGINEENSIGNDIILLEKPVIRPGFSYPFKSDVFTAIICLSGKSEGFINLSPQVSSASSLTVFMPDQILQHKETSEDFSALLIVTSKQFIRNLNIQIGSSLFASVNENPVLSLSESELNSMVTYYNLLKEAVKNVDNPFRMETVLNLTRAFFYGISYKRHKMLAHEEKSKNKIIFDDFLMLVRNHHKQERSVGFYAEKLCLTPKYFSSLIKSNSGRSAAEWIDSFVILEAKALLKSTNMTIEQISEELHFPSQSFFGKYFKRLEGISPTEYRRK